MISPPVWLCRVRMLYSDINLKHMKYLVKAIIPATVVRVFEVEAFNEGDALANYLRGEAFELIDEEKITTHDRDVVFEVDEK